MNILTLISWMYWSDNVNSALREGYDIIISCLGFKFDTSLFNESATDGSLIFHKYPRITYQYESAQIANLFYAGDETFIFCNV